MEIDGQIWVFVPSFLTTTQIQSQRIFNIGLIWGEALNHINTIGTEQPRALYAIKAAKYIVAHTSSTTAGKSRMITRSKSGINNFTYFQICISMI